MIQQLTLRFKILACLAMVLFLGNSLVLASQSGNFPQIYLAQMPFEPPPQPEYTPGEDATPAPEILNCPGAGTVGFSPALIGWETGTLGHGRVCAFW